MTITRFLDYLQLASLAAFALLFFGRVVHVRLAYGVRAIRIVRGKPWPEALLEALLVVALPLWLYEAVAYAWPLDAHLIPPRVNPVVLDFLAARVVGAVLNIAGLVLFASALGAFGASWRVGIDREAPGALVTAGVFSLSRNPIFVFMDAFAVGTFLLTGRVLFGLFALAAFAALQRQILSEEAFLLEHYGRDYERYRERTPRYLGRVLGTGNRD